MAFLNIEIVHGGETRADSVRRALQQVKEEADFVAVHDAARPLLVSEWVDAVFAAAEKSGAAIPAVPVSSTLKRVVDENVISETVSREGLWAAQTPQVFRRQLLIDAYNQATDEVATDEAQLVEQLGHPVSIIPGWPMNFKITTADDFTMAQAVLDSLPKKSLRSLHPFADERPGFLQD
jgi:2-C-methyl-D-erythritol 4-phosphate cytidylyltransferase